MRWAVVGRAAATGPAGAGPRSTPSRLPLLPVLLRRLVLVLLVLLVLLPMQFRGLVLVLLVLLVLMLVVVLLLLL